MYIEVTTLSEMLLVLDRLDRQDSCSALLWEASAVFSFLSRAPSCVRALCSAAGLKKGKKMWWSLAVLLGSHGWSLEAEGEPVSFGMSYFSSKVCGIVESSSCVVGSGTGVLLVCAMEKC